MQDKILEQAEKEYSPKKRLAALALEAPFFLIILPLLLVLLADWIDGRLGLPRFVNPPVNATLGLLMIAGGFALAFWTVYVQFTRGRGTPVPVMATQKLIVKPPYTLCRNPMVLGWLILNLGIGVLIGSISAVLLVIAGGALLLAYVKRYEEEEMVARFGQEYLDYKEKTPFLIPRLM